jgi:hypothetical protein
MWKQFSKLWQGRSLHIPRVLLYRIRRQKQNITAVEKRASCHTHEGVSDTHLYT